MNDKIRLTLLSHGMGCGCKLRPQFLEKVLQSIPPINDPRVIIGTGSSDDAAVFLLNPEQAIVQTLDFFTPIVDDPYDFGAIAATNAISDIYAMGAKPLFALNIVAFPSAKLPVEILESILKGASDKALEAGICILGGHSIDDEEPKFGMAVTGWVHPGKVLANNKAQPGDCLVLTKPVGTGIISTAIRKELADDDTGEEAIQWMKTLNKVAAETIAGFPVNACTDVTGFGLMGHLSELTRGSGVEAEIFFSKVPFMRNLVNLVEKGAVSGGTRGNLKYYSEWIDWSPELNETQRLMLCDAQTSGGLLFSIPEEYAHAVLDALHDNGILVASLVGRIAKHGKGMIHAGI
jgi:cysteine desulfurase